MEPFVGVVKHVKGCVFDRFGARPRLRGGGGLGAFACIGLVLLEGVVVIEDVAAYQHVGLTDSLLMLCVEGRLGYPLFELLL